MNERITKRKHNRANRIVELVEGTKSKAGIWYWRVKAGNGEILCHSETYKTKFHAQRMAVQMAHDIGSNKDNVVKYKEV